MVEENNRENPHNNVEIDLHMLRHSTAHVLAQAVKELFPETKLAIGPSIENGFYYDFDRDRTFSPDDLEKLEEKMKVLIKSNITFEYHSISKEEAITLFNKMGEAYKIELINEIEDNEVSIYRQGDFVDLCRGPHLKSTGNIKAFKLLSIAGAYWRGSEKNKMLQRIYGTAFRSNKELKKYLFQLEEAKKRDHRKIGKELDLFSVDEEIGPGLINWHPNGAIIRNIIETFWKDKHQENGYQLIYSPHIANLNLWKTSGHWDFYRDNMFSPVDIENISYMIKPMNCPFHLKIYKTRQRSYRELPIRWAELGTVYRYERSGVLHGLLRVRGFTQDDAHIFCREEQLEDEIKKVIEFILYILKSFCFEEYSIYISTKPEKFVGSNDNWQIATDALKNAVDKTGLPYELDPGEGVFYGPKIDIKIKDSLGRYWQCSTIQVDFNIPERFDILYIAEDGQSKRPIMIHRALMGSLERFFGCLIEHYAGAFPLWLSPAQVIILPITDKQNEYSLKIEKDLKKEKLRVSVDLRNEKIGFKIREAQLKKIPYMLIIGKKEEADFKVSLRKRGQGDIGVFSLEDIVKMTKEEIENKK